MKKITTLSIFVFLCLGFSYAQNKTFSIGTSVPNTNASLHVDSPTNNQGVLIPRLSTTQRTAMALSNADKGLMLYDTDLKSILIWNGTAWDSFYSNTTDNIGSAITGINSGTGGFGGLFQVTNVANASQAIKATTAGTGGAARFETNNAAGTSPNIESVTNAPGGALRATATGSNGHAFLAEITNATNNATALSVQNMGTGTAGLFQVINVANTYQAIHATTLGTGGAARFETNNVAGTNSNIESITNAPGGSLRAIATGINGYAISAEITNTANSASALSGYNVGTGPAGNFTINNTLSSSPTIKATTNGRSHALVGETTNVSNSEATIYATSNSNSAFAANFRNTNTSSSGGAIYLVTYGTGPTAVINHRGSTGNIIVIQSQDGSVARIDKTGKGFFNGGTQSSGADVAEMFEVEGAKTTYEPGDVLVISESTDRTVEKSSTANSKAVVGVYATKPGVTLTEKGMEENLDKLVPMGVIGVIPTKVCLENGPIKRGDLLVTSSKKGHAMKAVSLNGDGVFPSGIILGKALENFSGQEAGVIKVLVNVK